MIDMNSHTHQMNITRKAERAMAAIEIIVDAILIPGTDWPEITNRADGLAYLHEIMFQPGNEGETTAWWASIGILDAAATGTSVPTVFNTSRETVGHMLDAAAYGARQPEIADPFAGLGFNDAF